MDISIININDAPEYLEDVVQLGDANSTTLGFFSRGAFIKAAQDGLIFIAITDEQKCVGYLLYRIVKTKHRAAITHLCVDELYRGMGVARQLVKHLINNTQHLLGISLFCRRDYDSNKFWAHIGFEYRGEKIGRGKDQVPLTHYWYDHGHPTLFTLAKDHELQSKTVRAVIDANIFYELFSNPNHPLLADWLIDDLALCVTPEIFNEINRQEIKEQRIKSLDYAETFIKTSTKDTQCEPIYQYLRQLYPPDLRTQDESDLKQISHAIAFDAQFFVTNDTRFRNRLSDIVKKEFGVVMASPDDLIIHLDEKMNEAAYQPNRLAGSSIQIARLQSGQSDYLAEVFHRYSGEKKSQLRRQLSDYLENPQRYEAFVVASSDGIPIALLVLANDSPSILNIPFIRVSPSALSPALESHLIFWCVSRSVKMEKELIYVTEQRISSNLENALHSNSFIKNKGHWVKINVTGLCNSDNVFTVLQRLALKFVELESIVKKFHSDITDALLQKNFEQLISIEKYLWPLKISDGNIPAFIVPISPVWAIDLFDSKLGNQTLFGSDPALALRMENVYYRSSRTKVPTEFSRILWYVSKGRGQNQGVMAIRACAYVDKRVIAPPKELFKEFSKLGVYRWQNVLQTAKNDMNQELLAFRFSRTELFEKPVYLDKLKYIMSTKSAPQAPMSITNDEFNEIYQLGNTY